MGLGGQQLWLSACCERGRPGLWHMRAIPSFRAYPQALHPRVGPETCQLRARPGARVGRGRKRRGWVLLPARKCLLARFRHSPARDLGASCSGVCGDLSPQTFGGSPPVQIGWPIVPWSRDYRRHRTADLSACKHPFIDQCLQSTHLMWAPCQGPGTPKGGSGPG